jgi:hypothetical protein
MAYTPMNALGTTIASVTGSSSNVLAKASTVASCSAKIYNGGLVDLAYRLSSTAPTAVFATDCKLPAGKEHVIALPDGAVYVGAITAGGTTTFYCDLIYGD